MTLPAVLTHACLSLPAGILFSGWPAYFLLSSKQREYHRGWKRIAMWIWLVGGLVLAWTSVNDLFPPEGTRPSSVGADSSTSLAQEEPFIYPNPEVILVLFSLFGGWPYYFLRIHPGRPWFRKACLGNGITIFALILTPTYEDGQLELSEAIFFLCLLTPWVLLLAQGLAQRRRARLGNP